MDVYVKQIKYIPKEETILNEKVKVIENPEYPNLIITVCDEDESWKKRFFAKEIRFMDLVEGWRLTMRFDWQKRWVSSYIDLAQVTYDGCWIEVKDLLLDIRMRPSGDIEVLDMDQFVEATAKGLITQEQGTFALKNLTKLLEKIHANQFPDERVRKYLEEVGYEEKRSA